MPEVSASELTRLRTTKHATKLGLVVYRPRVLMTARVNGTQTQGDQTIAINNVVQFGTPRDHFTVALGSAAGQDDRGVARFRDYSGGVLDVGPHNSVLTNGDYITVYEEVRPLSILPKVQANGNTLEDGNVTYTDQNTNYKPLANFGPPAVAFRDPASGQAIVKFFSTAVAFASGATISAYEWTFPGGFPATSTSQGTQNNPVEVVWDTAGQYYVMLKVTDSNGTTHRSWRPVFILDRENASLYHDNIEIGSLEGDVDAGGWGCELTVHGYASETDFPAGAMVVLFAEDEFGAERISLGGDYRHRENIVFVGYIREGSLERSEAANAMTFQADGIGKVMDNLLAWPANLKQVSSPTKWHELKDMNATLIAHHILTRHSTIPHCADVVFDFITDYTFKYIDITEASLQEQINDQLLTAVRAKMGSSRTGRLYLSAYPQLYPRADQDNPNVLNATIEDLRAPLQMGLERSEREVSQIDFIGFGYNGQDPFPYYSLAPANQWATGRVEKIDGIRVDSQSEANEVAGLWLAWMNADYREITAAWRGNYRVFDVFPFESLRLTIDPTDNARGLAWRHRKMWIKRVTFNYTPPGVLTVDTALEAASSGKRGISNASDPDDDGVDDPDTIDPPPGTTLPPPPVVTPPTPTVPTPPIPGSQICSIPVCCDSGPPSDGWVLKYNSTRGCLIWGPRGGECDCAGTPAHVSTAQIDSYTATVPNTVAVTDGDYTYVLFRETSGATLPATFRFAVVDVSTPASPTVVGSYQFTFTNVGTTTTAPTAQFLGKHGNYVFGVMRQDTGDGAFTPTPYRATRIAVFDVTNPASPTLHDDTAFGTVVHSIGIFNAVMWESGNSVYLGGQSASSAIGTDGALKIFDLTDPSDVQFLATGAQAVSGTWEVFNYQIAYRNGYIYFVRRDSGSRIDVYDVSNPSSPTHAALYESGLDNDLGVTVAFDVNDANILYLGTGDTASGNFLTEIDFSDPDNPVQLDQIALASGAAGDYRPIIRVCGTDKIFTVHRPNAVGSDITVRGWENLDAIPTGITVADVTPLHMQIDGEHIYIGANSSPEDSKPYLIITTC